jgi:hypothetical protein
LNKTRFVTRGILLLERGTFSPSLNELSLSEEVINPISGGTRITLYYVIENQNN